jgi:hypothetical protein
MSLGSAENGQGPVLRVQSAHRFILPPVYNTIITYIFDPIGDNKTRFIRTMINCTNADATPEQKADFADTDMHTDYLNAVKARLEMS